MALKPIFILIAIVVLIGLAEVYYIGGHLKRSHYPNSQYSEKVIALLLADYYSQRQTRINPCDFSEEEANYLVTVPVEKFSNCILRLAPSNARDACLQAQKVFEFQQQEIAKRPALYLGVAAISKYLVSQKPYDYEPQQAFGQCSAAIRAAGR